MDETQQYVAMCEKATEIRNRWKPKVGDWFLNDYRGTTAFDKETEGKLWGNEAKKWEMIQCLTSGLSVKDYITVSDLEGSHIYNMEEFFKHRHVWLPRQDQLQDMLKEEIRHNHRNTLAYVKVKAPEGFIDLCLEYTFHNFVDEEEQYFDYVAFNSIEQFWLVFVMSKKYKKRWNGSDWIAEKGAF